MPDLISINRLKVSVYLGVPAEERSTPQEVEISLDMVPKRSLMRLDDDIQGTVDYYQVSRTIIEIAQAKPRKLIETLNEDILTGVLHTYPIMEASITTYKYIIPETEHVSIRMSLSRDHVF